MTNFVSENCHINIDRYLGDINVNLSIVNPMAVYLQVEKRKL
jgi:hypothetical protein